MNKFKRVLTAVAAAFLFGYCATQQVQGQLWLEFAHPSEPHQAGSFIPPIVIDELFDDLNASIQVPVVVVLLEFSDQQHFDNSHNAAFYEEMIFGADVGNTTLAEYYAQTSNGRIQIIPATESHGTDDDGIIGWVEAENDDSTQDLFVKRAEAIRRADDWMDFAQFDTDGDEVITAHELILILINPSPNANSGGQTQPTEPELIGVDGGDLDVMIPIGALGEFHNGSPRAHESSHPYFGHSDLYPKCGADGLINWTIGDGTICNILSDDCSAPANDECTCPDALNPTPSAIRAGSTVGYPNGMGPACGTAGAPVNETAWFEVYGTGSTFTASTCGGGTDFDSQLSVYCNGCEELSCVAGNDDATGCGASSSVSWCGEPDVSYLIVVHGSGGETGNFQLTVSDSGAACEATIKCGLAAAHSRHWYPYTPQYMGMMSAGANSDSTTIPLDPWAKIHLGLTKPKVIVRDGTYTVFAEEPQRSFSQQSTEPEAYIIYDPQEETPEAYNEYFILEARNDPLLPDQGLAIWLVNENWTEPFPDLTPNLRRVVRLIHRGGHNPSTGSFLWDGDELASYDFTADSSPRNSAWSDGTPSYIEVYDISGAGEMMTFRVRIPPIFVDDSNAAGPHTGSQNNPFEILEDGVDAIADGPRSIRIAGGSYNESFVIDTACTIFHWKGGSAVVGQ